MTVAGHAGKPEAKGPFMESTTRNGAILWTLLLLLAASSVANLLLYRKAARPLFDEADRPLIERTIADAAARSKHTGPDEIRADAFPIVMRWGSRTCVELRRHDGLGYIGACYDRHGRLIEEAEGPR